MEGVVKLVHVALMYLLTLSNQLVEEAEVTEVVAMDEGGEAMVGESRGGGKGELDYYIVGAMGGGTGEDKVGGSGDKDA